ncbi:MAG: DNA-binding protein [Omnitrophica bacterium RIFCSPHIGHO2_02_FULL_46_11]|nr:MAG: DNA-binding protein [Omnitrophica bacterium RIFCSPLOWO2_01_FULL_45_10b]OGW87163.1 MAG: DNA-binding protein [Omnitrophica bacterium RIFCSPHIGHO2_02_FULL_46_11]
MTKKIKLKALVPNAVIQNKILFLRGKKVMLDSALAELYGVETKHLTRQVRRNRSRFPADFLLVLTRGEVANLKCHFGTSSWGGVRKPPFAFTEHGILMLSSILNSERAIQVNIQIMRTFTKLRELMIEHRDLRQKIEEMEEKYDYQFKAVFKAIKKLIEPQQKSKKQIGFRSQ